MIERQHPALAHVTTIAAWLLVGLVLYIGLGIIVYLVLASLLASFGVWGESSNKTFIAGVSAAVFVHQLLALVAWLLLARAMGLPRMVAAVISIAGIAGLACTTVSLLMVSPA